MKMMMQRIRRVDSSKQERSSELKQNINHTPSDCNVWLSKPTGCVKLLCDIEGLGAGQTRYDPSDEDSTSLKSPLA